MLKVKSQVRWTGFEPAYSVPLSLLTFIGRISGISLIPHFCFVLSASLLPSCVRAFTNFATTSKKRRHSGCRVRCYAFQYRAVFLLPSRIADLWFPCARLPSEFHSTCGSSMLAFQRLDHLALPYLLLSGLPWNRTTPIDLS